jgi:type I restriction enzyme S subunit
MNHQDTRSTKPKDLAGLGELDGSTRPPLPPGWRWVRLGEVCEEQTGVRDPRRQPDSEFRYVDIASVDNKTKQITQPKILLGKNAPSRARQVIRTGDVLVATTRPNLNAVALVPPELDNEICSTGFCVLRAKPGLKPEFLFAWVQTPTFVQALTELVKGALYPAVTDNQVRAQWIPLPPLVEQERLVGVLRERLGAVARARRAAEEQLAAIEALPAALLRQAFRGGL